MKDKIILLVFVAVLISCMAFAFPFNPDDSSIPPDILQMINAQKNYSDQMLDFSDDEEQVNPEPHLIEEEMAGVLAVNNTEEKDNATLESNDTQDEVEQNDIPKENEMPEFIKQQIENPEQEQNVESPLMPKPKTEEVCSPCELHLSPEPSSNILLTIILSFVIAGCLSTGFFVYTNFNKKRQDNLREKTVIDSQLKLYNYVSMNMKAGYSISQIRQSLLKSGWEKELLDETLARISIQMLNNGK